MTTSLIITKAELLKHWQGHRALTRRVIEAFPEKELFEFSIAGMRPFGDLAKELLSIALPGLQGIVSRADDGYTEDGLGAITTKGALLAKWDEDTPQINALFNQIPEADFHETLNLLGKCIISISEYILVFFDYISHHRGEGYVYLRSLGIQLPFFWER